jgi:hypothetical protein
MRNYLFIALAILSVIPIITSSDYAVSIIPGWHTAIYSGWDSTTCLLGPFYLVVYFMYRKLALDQIRVSGLFFWAHLGLALVFLAFNIVRPLFTFALDQASGGYLFLSRLTGSKVLMDFQTSLQLVFAVLLWAKRYLRKP